MSAPEDVPSPRLAEFLVSAAAQAAPATGALVPSGIPVRNGRLHLGRLRSTVGSGERLALIAGFATAVWIGPPAANPPPLGRLAYRSDTSIDARGRLVVEFRVRGWLAVADTRAFEVVVVAADGGLLIVPVEDFARRWAAVGG